jgi:hypothetical protein
MARTERRQLVAAGASRARLLATGRPERCCRTCRIMMVSLPCCPNSGQYCATASSRAGSPRSANWCTSNATKGLLAEKIQNSASGRQPSVLSRMTSPCRSTHNCATAPRACTKSTPWDSAAASTPTSSGEDSTQSITPEFSRKPTSNQRRISSMAERTRLRRSTDAHSHPRAQSPPVPQATAGFAGRPPGPRLGCDASSLIVRTPRWREGCGDQHSQCAQATIRSARMLR